MKSYKVLIIGCGNIGALYDWDSDQQLTHVKAFAQIQNVEISIFDSNETLANKVANRYNTAICSTINVEVLKSFDCISICSPTHTHYNYLKLAFEANCKLVVCEKPVAYQLNELEELEKIYSNSRTKVLVNYIRRFLPAYKNLKHLVKSQLQVQPLLNINITYQRGIINNASHAIDLVHYLTDKVFEFSSVQILHKTYDEFEIDPTVSMQANWQNTSMSLIGIANAKFSFFEINLFFSDLAIIIKQAGNVIEVYKSQLKTENFYKPLLIQQQYSENNCLYSYMKWVIENAMEILEDKTIKDNFIESIQLNSKIVNIIA